MTEVARLYVTHAIMTNAVRQAMKNLSDAVRSGDSDAVAVWRDTFEKNSFVLHNLDEIVYGAPRNLTDVLEAAHT